MSIQSSLWALAILSLSVWAHDGGHGPQVSDTGNYGGTMTAVVNNKDAALNEKAKAVYKAEMVRSSNGLEIYLYDLNMKPLDLKLFGPKATAVFEGEARFSGKKLRGKKEFELNAEGTKFVGKLPEKVSAGKEQFDAKKVKTFNVDIVLKGQGEDYLLAFDGLNWL